MPSLDTAYLIAQNTSLTEAGGVNRSENVSANDISFRWKLLAGVAALAVVSVIGWQGIGGWSDQHGAPQLAQVPVKTNKADMALQQAMVDGEPQLMIRDPQLDALLAAHRQFGGTSALQMPAGFLRNATFEGAAR